MMNVSFIIRDQRKKSRKIYRNKYKVQVTIYATGSREELPLLGIKNDGLNEPRSAARARKSIDWQGGGRGNDGYGVGTA